jgi:hypothetical protein
MWGVIPEKSCLWNFTCFVFVLASVAVMGAAMHSLCCRTGGGAATGTVEGIRACET